MYLQLCQMCILFDEIHSNRSFIAVTLLFKHYACLLPSLRWYQIILLGNRGNVCEQLARDRSLYCISCVSVHILKKVHNICYVDIC